MNKQEIVEYLRQNMPEFHGSEEEIEIKTALYIYIELGKIKSFDEKYYFGNAKTKKKIYNLARRQRSNTDEIAKHKKIICVSLTHLYCDILKEFGIHSIDSEPEKEGHIHPIIITKNKKAFIADIQQDLANIQTKSRLEHFEYGQTFPRNKDNEINQKLLTQMLVEIGYIKDEGDYKDEAISCLVTKVKKMNPHEALQEIVEDEKLYAGNEEMDIVEIRKFYKKVLERTVPQFMWGKIFAFNCYREKEGERDCTVCIFSKEDTIKPYVFSKKDKRFLPVEISKLKELEEDGLHLGVIDQEVGVKELRKYMKKQNKNMELEDKSK